MTGGAGFSRDAQNTNQQNRGISANVRGRNFKRSGKTPVLSSRQKTQEEQEEERVKILKAKKAYLLKFLMVLIIALAASTIILFALFF